MQLSSTSRNVSCSHEDEQLEQTSLIDLSEDRVQLWDELCDTSSDHSLIWLEELSVVFFKNYKRDFVVDVLWSSGKCLYFGLLMHKRRYASVHDLQSII